jgi:hypothetical protein
MSIELWKLPVAPTALVKSPSLAVLPKRQCQISMEFEVSAGIVRNTLLFEGVEAFKCTFLTSCSAEMFNTAYGKLVRLGASQWLAETQKINTRISPKELQHLMICFDDGPCYEFICTGFRVC